MLEKVGRNEDVAGVRLPLLFGDTLERLQALEATLVADPVLPANPVSIVVAAVAKIASEAVARPNDENARPAAGSADAQAPEHAAEPAEDSKSRVCR